MKVQIWHKFIYYLRVSHLKPKKNEKSNENLKWKYKAIKCLYILIYTLIDLNQSIFETLSFSYLLAVYRFSFYFISNLMSIAFHMMCLNYFRLSNEMLYDAETKVVIKWSEKKNCLELKLVCRLWHADSWMLSFYLHRAV